MTRTQERRPLLGLRRRPGRLALALMRMPLRAYAHDKGHLLGQTFLEVTHVGRRSGATYRSVAMVLHRDGSTGEAVICAAWGPTTDSFRNLQAYPATRVRIGREAFAPEQRFLGEEEAYAVAVGFRAAHPHRLWLMSRVLGLGDLEDEAALRAFVHQHPFVAFRPTVGSAVG